MGKNYFFLLKTILFSLLLLPVDGIAKVRLPNILSDNMVIQQNSKVHLWGWGDAGKTIKVTTSWQKNTYKVNVGNDGKWDLWVPTPAASYTPLSVSFDDGEKVVLKNMLAGEVWVCAGQSNMEMPVKGFDQCPVQDSNEAIIESFHLKDIHFVKIPSLMSFTLREDAACKWAELSPGTVQECSAVGYAFAKELNKALDIPVGLILANKGGTRVESWLSRENLEKYTDEPLDSIEIVKKYPTDYHRPLLWGNATFHPIINYTVKGILFYQGCSNVGNPGNQYSERLKLLVEQWRKQFGNNNLPFYLVQIAPYRYDKADADWGAKLREQQYRAAQIIPNSDIVGTLDLVYPYEIDQIHPAQKFPVGKRLAWLALNKQYGISALPCESAAFESMMIEGDVCKIKLQNLYGGLNQNADLQGFEVAGEDRKFYPATVKYTGNNTIAVQSDAVKRPVAVRYCFKNFSIGHVRNQAGLPLLPFRTDNW